MRRFHSYGPVNPRLHFCVPRTALVEQCIEQILGEIDLDPGAGGHYFTIWAPRQTGKTWLMRKAAALLKDRFGDRFILAKLSAQGRMVEDDPPERFLPLWPGMIRDALGFTPPVPADFEEWRRQLSCDGGIFDRPVLLFMDEFDSLPSSTIERLITNFRNIYLSREAYRIHGLALIGVRAVLGVDSPRGSPFNVQRSLHVPNLSLDEVTELFGQFQRESGQVVEPAVVATLHEMTRGQPGLAGWFGELLTEKYNPGGSAPITMETWHRVYSAACQVEPNNTMLNLLKKATSPYLPQLLEVFTRADIPFSFGQDWCNYFYLNGILDSQEVTGETGLPQHVCRFSSPFVQQRLFSDLSVALLKPTQDLPLEPLDALDDVFTPNGLMIPALLRRYVAYLGRLRARGQDPFTGQPLRKNLRPTEAVGHFHLHYWLNLAVGKRCIISPEFPTGNGTVDLHLRWHGHRGVIEVKSFVDLYQLGLGQEQAAGYAVKLGLGEATLAVFIPVTDQAILDKLSGTRRIGAVTVTTVAIASIA